MYFFSILARYNTPPIRAVDLSTHRGYHQRTMNSTSSSLPSSPIGPIGHRRKSDSKSSIILFSSFIIFSLYSILVVGNELNSSNTNSSDTRQSHISSSSPPSSYAASSSHIAEMDDYDYDLDSGYNDEYDSPLFLSSTYLIPTSPWYDIPVADEMFIWVMEFLFSFF